MENLPVLPAEVIVDPGKKQVMVTRDLDSVMPSRPSGGYGISPNELFRQADKAYSLDSLAYLQGLEESVFSFDSTNGAKIDCSLIPGQGSEALIMWAPFSDCAPRSSAEDLDRYTRMESPNLSDKVKAAPNSWNQITKSAVVWEFLRSVGREMPVLTIFSPLPSLPHNAYSHDDYKKIRRGDFSPAGSLAVEAMRAAQDRLHGPVSETQLDQIHAHGASLGASQAIGMASMLACSTKVKSVTAQELIIAPRNVFGSLATRFMLRDPVGEVSDWNQINHLRTVADEPLIRREIDAHGNEPAMIARMLRGMSKVSRLKGLTRPARNQTPRLIERLAEHDVSVAIPLAENSGPSRGTADWLPKAGEQVITVRATKSERTSHLIDEHVGLTALLATLHVAQTQP